MNNITPEMLKVVAEGMGHEVRLTELFEPALANGELCLKGTAVRYNPLTNNDQMVEIMEKLKISCDWLTLSKFWSACTNEGNGGGEGKTINEAVVMAAYEYFKNEQ